MNSIEIDTEKISSQIKEQMRKAFFDLIDQTVNSDKPDYEWNKKLYLEIRDRLSRFLKKDSKNFKKIQEDFDGDFFYQLITNDVFDFNSMLNLIENTFYWIKNLQAPLRDQTTEESKNKILKAEPQKMISTFLKEVHICLDNLDEDMENFIKSLPQE